MTNFDRKLAKLMHDYGYELRGTHLYSLGIRGFSSEWRMDSGYKSLFAAAESLIPIVRDDEYFSRFQRICNS